MPAAPQPIYTAPSAVTTVYKVELYSLNITLPLALYCYMNQQDATLIRLQNRQKTHTNIHVSNSLTLLHLLSLYINFLRGEVGGLFYGLGRAIIKKGIKS